MLPALLALVTAYRTAFNNWLLSKNQFQQYKTENTRLAAIENIRKLLSVRNDWQTSYLKNLRQNLADTTNIANYSQTTLYLDLETEIHYLENSSSEASSLSSLDQAAKYSQNWEARLYHSDDLATKAKNQIITTRLNNFQKQLQNYVDEASPSPTLDLVKQKLIQSASTTDLDLHHQLLIDAGNLLLQIQQ